MSTNDDMATGDEVEPDPDRIDRLLHDRLGRLGAELTGHLPTLDPRLETLFGADAASRDQLPDRTEEIVVERASDPKSARTGRRALLATVAIAAAFALVVGSAVYVAARTRAGSPVETASQTTASATRGVSERQPTSDGEGATGSTRNAGPGADGGDSPGAASDEADDRTGSDETPGDDHTPSAQNGWIPFLGGDQAEALQELWAEHQVWVECVAGAVDGWLESWTGDDSVRGFDPDVVANCGEPPFPFGDDGTFVWPDLDLPGVELPDLDGFDVCHEVEDGDAVTLTCRWPPCRSDGGSEQCPSLEQMPWLDELLPGEWPDDFDFRFDLEWDPDDLERHLEALLPDGWRDRLDLEELEDRFGELDERFGAPDSGRSEPGSGSFPGEA